MIQIIPEIRNKSFSDRLLNGFSQAAQEGAVEIPKFFGHKMMQHQENEAIKRLIGEDLSGLNPDLKKVAVQHLLKKNTINQEKAFPLKSGLDTIKRMREINKKGGLGRGSSFTKEFSDNISKRYGEYEQLGKSLIQLGSSIPIRNKAEFETLAENLYDPTIRDSERDGILDAMERIINQSLQQYGGQSNMPQSQQTKKRSLEEIFG